MAGYISPQSQAQITTFARGAENHACSTPNTPNQHGVSPAPNAGPTTQKHVASPSSSPGSDLWHPVAGGNLNEVGRVNEATDRARGVDPNTYH